jgi:hypothetical protein
MAKSYYSTVFDQPADEVWAVLRDFGNYDIWVDGVDASGIEDGRAGDAVGAIRFARMGETHIRQRLLAHSDRERSYTYAFCEPYRFAVRNFVATIKITPVIDRNRAFAEWWTTFDCAADEHAHWTEFFASSFAKWLESLRRHMVTRAGPARV